MVKETRYRNRIELLQGTLDLLVLQTLQWGPQHGYGISQAIKTNSGDVRFTPVQPLIGALREADFTVVVHVPMVLPAEANRLGVELEPEVRRWLEDLPSRHFGAAAFHIDLLGDRGPLLGEPYTRQLSGKLRELRFHLAGEAVRVTYWIAPGRRIILLTVFTKRRMRETAEVRRAEQAMRRCRAEMHVAEDDDG